MSENTTPLSHGIPAAAYPVPPLANAQRHYVELFGSALVLNAYFRIALLALCLVAAGLIALNVYTMHRYARVKPLVIRIDDIGRAQAITYDALNYKPARQAPELKYFLVQFIPKHYGRMRATVKTQYAESLFFLESALAEATIAHDRQAQTLERFLTDTSDEVEIQVKNVTLDNLKAPPSRPPVDFDRVFYPAGTPLGRTR